MKYLIALCIFLSIPDTEAQSEHGQFKFIEVKGRPVLISKNRSLVADFVEVMQEWKAQLREISALEITEDDEGRFILDLDGLLPTRMYDLLKISKPRFMGPNCWNSIGAVTQGRPLSYWDSFEPFARRNCRQLESFESLTSGDILSISESASIDSWGKSLHAYVYLNPQLVFTKNGLLKSAPYQLSDPQAVQEFYKAPKECYRPSDTVHAKSCQRFTVAYRCEWKQSTYPDELQRLGLLIERAQISSLSLKEQRSLLDLYGNLAYKVMIGDFEDPYHIFVMNGFSLSLDSCYPNSAASAQACVVQDFINSYFEKRSIDERNHFSGVLRDITQVLKTLNNTQVHGIEGLKYRLINDVELWTNLGSF